MIFHQFQDPASSTYTYLLARRPGGEALLIDPVYEQVDVYLTHLKRLDLKLVKAMDTHVHADHVTGLGLLRDLTRCVTVMGERGGADVVSIRLKEGDEVDLDGIKLRAMYTPGHTDDSYSFVGDDRVFTGDALLIGGTGRTDFQNGDPHAAYDSLFNKLLRLPDETLVYPAHDYRGNLVSTIANERVMNPRLQVSNADEYAEIMNNLNLANPKMMDVAVPANRRIGESIAKFVADEELLSAADIVGDTERSAIFVDLREPFERARDGAIPASVCVPYNAIDDAVADEGELRRLAERSSDPLVLYCAYGERSALALKAARIAGITGLHHLDGGLAAWIRAGGDVEPA